MWVTKLLINFLLQDIRFTFVKANFYFWQATLLLGVKENIPSSLPLKKIDKDFQVSHAQNVNTNS